MQNSYTQLTKNKLTELKSLINDNGFNAEKPKKNVKIFSKKLTSEIDVVKSIYILNIPYQQVLKCMEDPKFQQKQGEDYIQSQEDIPSNENNVHIEFIKGKGQFLFSGRDFLTASTREKLNDEYYYAATSIDIPSVVTDKSRIRAEIYINGYSIKPVNQNQTEMVYITSLKLNGNLTQSMSKSYMLDDDCTYPADVEKLIQQWK